MASHPSKSKGPDSNEKKVVPPGLYLGALLMTCVGVRYAANAVIGTPNPDPRNMDEMAEQWLKSRGEGESESAEDKKKPNKKGHIRGQRIQANPTAKDVRITVRNALCFLNAIGHPEGDAFLDDPDRGKEYIKPPAQRESDVFYSPTKNGVKGEAYHYFPNLFNYLADNRVFMAQSAIDNLRHNDDVKDKIGWATANYAPPTGVNDSKKEREAFYNYVKEDLLGAKLACPQWEDGSCMIDYQGRECLLLEPLAQVVTTANHSMFIGTKGQQIEPIICWRSDRIQAAIVGGVTGCQPGDAREGANAPGKSSHGMGLAMDVANWAQAEDYLAEIGVACDFVPNDQAHCSFGEQNASAKLLGKLQGKAGKWLKEHNPFRK